MDSEREGCTRAMRMPSSTTRPWENVEFAAPGGKDRWRLDLVEGWMIRCHREPRRRAFHPVHKKVPYAVSSLEPTRVTVGSVGRRQLYMCGIAVETGSIVFPTLLHVTPLMAKKPVGSSERC